MKWKAGASCAFASLLLVAIAYQLPATLVVDMARPISSAWAVEGFHDAEDGYRWTRARSRILFPDPGGRREGRLELFLSGFRPPGEAPPVLVVESAGERLRLRPERRAAVYSLDVTTRGLLDSDLAVELRSETFSPGVSDERALGVRVHEARLILPGWGSLPSLRQMAAVFFSSLFAFALVAGARREPRLASAVALALGLFLALALALRRTPTAFLLPWLPWLLGAALAVQRWMPAVADFAADTARATIRGGLRGASVLVTKPAALLAVSAAVAACGGFLWGPRATFDVGSGRAEALARRFAGFDSEEGVSFREAFADATLDLRDFGGRARWSVAIRASLAGIPDGERRRGVLVRAGDEELVAELGTAWQTFEFSPPRSGVWRAGQTLTFPGFGGGTRLRVARVELDRGYGLPSLRSLVLVTGFVLSLFAGVCATGLSRRPAAGVAAVSLALPTAGLALEPDVFTAFLPTLLLVAAAAFAVAVLASAFLRSLETRRWLPELDAWAVTVATLGFVAWAVASTYPLYDGGHFGYHTSIAEEIWNGQFLHYYLPEPGSMLSRQPQWGNLVVPHSCLYHTVSAPFAALPRYWFHTTTKLFLALLLSSVALMAALVATKVGDRSSGVYAAAAVVLLPTGFQLLDLGHLMTLFGCWASALALGFLVLRAGRLSERTATWSAIALLSLSFLSYTGSLLFGSMSVGAAAAFLLRRQPRLARRLAGVLVASWGLSFFLYYVHWTWPFLTETLPALLARTGEGGSIDVAVRLLNQPQKLAYTFGLPLVPVVGLLGLTRVAAGAERVLLFSWASVLVVFSLADVYFNFLLKHHYFTFPSLAIGLALALGWLPQKKWPGRVFLAIFFVAIGLTGLREALRAASGSG